MPILVRLAVAADPRHLSARHTVEALKGQSLYATALLIDTYDVP